MVLKIGLITGVIGLGLFLTGMFFALTGNKNEDVSAVKAGAKISVFGLFLFGAGGLTAVISYAIPALSNLSHL